MERFKKVLNPLVILLGVIIILIVKLEQSKQEIMKEDLAKGFDECMRVLKVGGTLVFKWSDCQINVKKLLEVVPYKPLFGQQRGTTHWMTFVKF
jgi:hypothetical protein